MRLSMNILKNTYGGQCIEFFDNPQLSWPIPKSYEVIQATLASESGRVICDFQKDPLCLWAYSFSASGTVTYNELLPHIFSSNECPEYSQFHFRNQYVGDSNCWGFSLPYDTFLSLDKSEKYNYNIQTKFEDRPLTQHILGDLKGKNNIVLVAHLDHPHQLNDGLTSCIINCEIFEKVHKSLENLNLIVLNAAEIVGTVYILDKFNISKENTKHAISTNGLSLNSPFEFQFSSKNGASQIDKALMLMQSIYCGDSKIYDFRKGWGNDEIAFEVPSVEINCCSIYRWPHNNYHTIADDFSCYDENSSYRSIKFIIDLLETLDKNYTIKKININHLIKFSNPNINLYLPPAQMSESKISVDSLILEFDKIGCCLNEDEIKFLYKDPQRANDFMNGLLPFLYGRSEFTLIDLAYEFQVPPKLVLFFYKRLESLGYIKLSFI